MLSIRRASREVKIQPQENTSVFGWIASLCNTLWLPMPLLCKLLLCNCFATLCCSQCHRFANICCATTACHICRQRGKPIANSGEEEIGTNGAEAALGTKRLPQVLLDEACEKKKLIRPFCTASPLHNSSRLSLV